MEWYSNEFSAHEWNPANYNVARLIGLILNTDYAPLDKRLADIHARLEKTPAFYAQAQENLGSITIPHTELALQQHQGTKSLLTGRVSETIAEAELDETTKAQYQQAVDKAVAAIDDYVDYLNERLPALKQGEVRDFRIGDKLYERKYALDVASGYTAKEIYDLAVAEKNRLHGLMIETAKKLYPKYFPDQDYPENPLEGVAQVLFEISKHHATPETFVESVRKQIPELAQFVADNDLMDTFPEKPLVVRETPEYQRGFSIASIESPGPYDTDANTYYNVSPIEHLSEEEAESHLREYNHYMMQILNIHEAIPGHYTQLIHSNKAPSLVKSIFGNGAMIEGWAVYTERMMLEEGYGNNSPELWLMYYKWNLRAVVNTVLDYSIQVKGMTEDEALKLLMEEAFQERAEATGKWRRASLSQVQLTSYYTGYKEIYAFREQCKAVQGDDFNLKNFHNQFLSYGSAPVKVIKQLMDCEPETTESES